MSPKINGGPAFPVDTRGSDSDFAGQFGHQTGPTTWQFSGMTLRDYFAAKAMAAIITSPDGFRGLDWGLHSGKSIIENFGLFAYDMADAMLKTREE